VHIAIDDTYGPIDAQPTKYVTGARRTYVAVEFPDKHVEEIRDGVRVCLAEMPALLGVSPSEFHFADIYNRKGVWKNVSAGQNLRIFSFFADIYRRYRWNVHIQTVDERTLADHNLEIKGKIDGIDLAERDGQALLFLLTKIKSVIPPAPNKLTLRIDAGRNAPGSPFANTLFGEWGDQYDGQFAASDAEPLIQIADFLAFSINRNTHLQIKPHRTEIDWEFMELITSMNIQSPDFPQVKAKRQSLGSDLDAAHANDRRDKGLE